MSDYQIVYQAYLKQPSKLPGRFDYKTLREFVRNVLKDKSRTGTGTLFATYNFIKFHCNISDAKEEDVKSFNDQGNPNNIPASLKEKARKYWRFSISKSSSKMTNEHFNISNFSSYLSNYNWGSGKKAKHHLFGYPPDCFPDFAWVNSLENRFQWLKDNIENDKVSGLYLVKEMIHWGGNQKGVLQEFEDNIGLYNFKSAIQNVTSNLHTPEKAIREALDIPGLGLTYASKLLRFLEPEKYGALDSILRKYLSTLGLDIKPKNQSKERNIKDYLTFIQFLEKLKSELEDNSIKKPSNSLNQRETWNIAEIEMSLFHVAQQNKK